MRRALKWPDNARVALAVIVNLEHWDWEVPPGTPLPVSPMGRGQEGSVWTGNQSAFPDIDAQTQADHTRSMRLLGKLMTLSRGLPITSRLSICSNGG
jgi:hypothetical protein